VWFSILRPWKFFHELAKNSLLTNILPHKNAHYTVIFLSLFICTVHVYVYVCTTFAGIVHMRVHVHCTHKVHMYRLHVLNTCCRWAFLTVPGWRRVSGVEPTWLNPHLCIKTCTCTCTCMYPTFDMQSVELAYLQYILKALTHTCTMYMYIHACVQYSYINLNWDAWGAWAATFWVSCSPPYLYFYFWGLQPPQPPRFLHLWCTLYIHVHVHEDSASLRTYMIENWPRMCAKPTHPASGRFEKCCSYHCTKSRIRR